MISLPAWTLLEMCPNGRHTVSRPRDKILGDLWCVVSQRDHESIGGCLQDEDLEDITNDALELMRKELAHEASFLDQWDHEPFLSASTARRRGLQPADSTRVRVYERRVLYARFVSYMNYVREHASLHFAEHEAVIVLTGSTDAECPDTLDDRVRFIAALLDPCIAPYHHDEDYQRGARAGRSLRDLSEEDMLWKLAGAPTLTMNQREVRCLSEIIGLYHGSEMWRRYDLEDFVLAIKKAREDKTA